MAFSPYDWNEAIQHRSEYVQNRLRDGSPVVALSTQEAVMVLTIHRARRKVFEIYDRLLYSAIGNQADIETIRNTAIDFAHREGYSRSPDDVSIQRLVGFAVSPLLKRAFGEAFSSLFVIRAVFAEMGRAPEDDQYFSLNFDGEFSKSPRYAVVGGTEAAEEQMLKVLQERAKEPPALADALDLALRVWATGRLNARSREAVADDSDAQEKRVVALFSDEIKQATVEVGVLERSSQREGKFRLLGPTELEPALERYRSAATT
ncbi:MAG TPA: hypothetical protein VGN26_23085 [Armatimonadota bacterium]|jgi:proteasome alpha subunit